MDEYLTLRQIREKYNAIDPTLTLSQIDNYASQWTCVTMRYKKHFAAAEVEAWFAANPETLTPEGRQSRRNHSKVMPNRNLEQECDTTVEVNRIWDKWDVGGLPRIWDLLHDHCGDTVAADVYNSEHLPATLYDALIVRGYMQPYHTDLFTAEGQERMDKSTDWNGKVRGGIDDEYTTGRKPGCKKVKVRG